MTDNFVKHNWKRNGTVRVEVINAGGGGVDGLTGVIVGRAVVYPNDTWPDNYIVLLDEPMPVLGSESDGDSAFSITEVCLKEI